MASGRGSVSADVLQLSLRDVAAAFVRVHERGDRLFVLADARLSEGGLGSAPLGTPREIDAARLITYGGSDRTVWMHAKNVHLRTATGRPTTWVTNVSFIPDTHKRSELSVRIDGDAAAAAHAVTDAARTANPAAMRASIDAAAGAGYLVNDPVAGRFHLRSAMKRALDARRGHELLVVTKGIEDSATSTALVEAARRGTTVHVFVRDLARRDAVRLLRGGVDPIVMSGGPKPRINLVAHGDQAIIGTAFWWRNMVGDPEHITSRDTGLLLQGEAADAARRATMASVRAQTTSRPASQLLDEGALPEHI